MRYNLATSMAHRLSFDEAVRNWARECVPNIEGRLTDEILHAWREIFLEELVTDDIEEAEARFDSAFKEVFNHYQRDDR